MYSYIHINPLGYWFDQNITTLIWSHRKMRNNSEIVILFIIYKIHYELRQFRL
jgi:hypothetical protein